MASTIKQIGDDVADYVNSCGPFVTQFEPAYYKYPFDLAVEVEKKIKVVVTPLSISTNREARDSWVRQINMAIVVFSDIKDQVNKFQIVDEMLELLEGIEDCMFQSRTQQFGEHSLKAMGIGLDRPVSDAEMMNRGSFQGVLQLVF